VSRTDITAYIALVRLLDALARSWSYRAVAWALPLGLWALRTASTTTTTMVALPPPPASYRGRGGEQGELSAVPKAGG
jgi:hypothetical protein